MRQQDDEEEAHLPGSRDEMEAMGFDPGSIDWHLHDRNDDDLIYYDTDAWPWDTLDWRKYLG